MRLAGMPDATEKVSVINGFRECFNILTTSQAHYWAKPELLNSNRHQAYKAELS